MTWRPVCSRGARHVAELGSVLLFEIRHRQSYRRTRGSLAPNALRTFKSNDSNSTDFLPGYEVGKLIGDKEFDMAFAEIQKLPELIRGKFEANLVFRNQFETLRGASAIFL